MFVAKCSSGSVHIYTHFYTISCSNSDCLFLFFFYVYTEKTSYITGRSVHNQRIKRLWRDVWCAVTSNYYAAFQYLQKIGALDPDNEKDLICLHYVMVPRLNVDLNLFRWVWDRHPLSSEGNRSPQQLWVSVKVPEAPASLRQAVL